MDHLNLGLNDDFRPLKYDSIFDTRYLVGAAELYPTAKAACEALKLPVVDTFHKIPMISYNFHDFPEKRCGWNVDDETGLKQIEGMSGVPVPQFLQSWLFFGLLHTVIQLPEDQSLDDTDFILGDYINTRKLEGYLTDWDTWECDVAQKGTLSQHLRMIRAQIALDRARDVVLRYCSMDGKNYQSQPGSADYIPDELALSLMVIGETLTAAKSKIVKKVGFSIRGWHGDANEGWGTPKCLVKKMENEFWCPRTVEMLKGQLRSHATSLLSAYRSHDINFQHDVRHKELKCTRDRCYVKSVDAYNEYVTQHHPDCHNHDTCLKPPLDMAEVREVLKGPYYPLMEYVRGSGAIKVIPYTPHTKYATISHVWADGYGNPEENELWECQLNYFADLFQNLPGKPPEQRSFPFWIDTLAIPVDKHEVNKRPRKDAITRIYDTYTNATYTIVLDHGLTRARYGTTYYGAAMRILASGWMRRLWTLQEAYLSKRLLFAFKGNLLKNLDDLEELYPEEDDMLTSNIPSAARNYFHNLLGQDRRARISGLPPAHGFGLLASVWRATQWRTTGHPEHETLALATLLNVDNEKFVSEGVTRTTTNANRTVTELAREKKTDEELETMMRDLWVLLDETAPGCIPPGIIFLSGRRLSIPGFGWAPFTWMAGQKVDYPDPLSTMTAPAVLMDKGLSVQYPGFLLRAKNYNDIVQLSGDKDFHFPVDSTLLEWYSIAWKEGEGRIDRPPTGGVELKQLAIILCRPRPREIPEIGLLVEIHRTIKQRNMGGQKESKVYHVYIIRRLKIKREVKEEQLAAWREIMIQSIRQPNNIERGLTHDNMAVQAGSGVGGEGRSSTTIRKDMLVFGEVLDSNQRWYVDGRHPPKPMTEEEPTLANSRPPPIERRTTPIHQRASQRGARLGIHSSVKIGGAANPKSRPITPEVERTREVPTELQNGAARKEASKKEDAGGKKTPWKFGSSTKSSWRR